MTAVSAALAAVAVLVLRPPWGWVRLRVAAARPVVGGTGLLRGILAAAVVGSVLLLPPAPTVLAWTAAGVGATVWRRRRRHEQRRRAAARRDRCHGILDGLVTELRAGASPATAVLRLAREESALEPCATVAAHGGDIATSLVVAGRRRGQEALMTVGHAWAVSESTGAALAAVLERVRDAAREDRELEREVAAGVGPARATATLLIAMPPMGLALGAGLGVDPVAVVTTTVAGAGCVAVGTAFAMVGVLWIDGVAEQVEERR